MTTPTTPSTLDIEPKLKIFHKSTSVKLFALADATEEVDRQGNLFMSRWGLLGGGLRQNFTWEALTQEMECGFAACALGTGATRFEGLEITTCRYGEDCDCGDLDVKHDGNKGFDAGASFFGITLEESQLLFMPETPGGTTRSNHTVVADIRTLAQQYKEKGL